MNGPIKNVAVVGGSGNLGQHIVRELLHAGFTVTVLKRSSTSSTTSTTTTFPGDVQTREIADYTSIPSLTAALEGQDAVVCTISTGASIAGVQKPLVDAAVAAGVRRFVPSEFGINTRFLEDGPIKRILGGKLETLGYLHEMHKREKEKGRSFTWTGISTGLFFDWGLDFGSIGVAKSSRTATIYDSGDEPFQATNLRTIGRAVAAVLRQPERTVNRYLTIASFNPTKNEIHATIERLTGEKWQVHRASTAEHYQIGLDKLDKGDYMAFSHFLRHRIHRDGAGLAVTGPDNALDLLGIEEESLEDTLREWLGRE
ncbi:NAD(P)-binding protein [Xylariaceae sp. FL0594]|nr:NAD(P)-binding protein [Xylariaceae sp. FL0594]